MAESSPSFPIIREAVASFPDREHFHRAVANLLAAGFDTADMSVLASHDSLAAAGEPPAPQPRLLPAGLALVDALLVADRFVGSRVLFAPERLIAAVLAIADPASVGVSPIGGLLDPCLPNDDAGLELRFAPVARAGQVVSAPMSPGLYAPVGVARCARLALGETVEASGPGILALDGDRYRAIAAGSTVRFRVQRNGPNVIDVPAVLAAAAAAGVYVTGSGVD